MFKKREEVNEEVQAQGCFLFGEDSNEIKELYLFISLPPNREIRSDNSFGINTLNEHFAGSRCDKRSALGTSGANHLMSHQPDVCLRWNQGLLRTILE